jgi:hypothetical protein
MKNPLLVAFCSITIVFLSSICLAELSANHDARHVIPPTEPPSPYDTNLSSVSTTPTFDEQLANTPASSMDETDTIAEFNPDVAVISTPLFEKKYIHTKGTQIPLLNADSSMKITPTGFSKTWCERHPERCEEHQQHRKQKLAKHCQKYSKSPHCI